MASRTKVDRLAWLRERSEDAALGLLARARSELDQARERRARAVEGARHDGRVPGRAELWELEEAAHRRALQAVRAAERDAQRAQRDEVAAVGRYAAAHRAAESVRRLQARRREELALELRRRERRSLDELATTRFNARS